MKNKRPVTTNPIPKTYFTKKLQLIKCEMDSIHPEILLEKVDPTIDSTKTIEQIQKYHTLINRELAHYIHQQHEKEEIVQKNAELKKQIEELIKPQQIDYLRQSNDKSISQSMPQIKQRENKPVIDYRVKIRSLEKDIVYTYQDYNKTKAKNTQLMNELDELRKQVIHKSTKLNEMKKTLDQAEKSYFQQKKEIEKSAENKEEVDIYNKIQKNQKKLQTCNMEMINKIKETDQFLNEKLAKKKCLDYETEQLEKEAKKAEEKYKKELNDFNNLYKAEIEKMNNFDNSSKIIDMLDPKKISALEEMLKDMFEETKTENIQSFVEYFIKSCEEYKAFQDSIATLSKTVVELEKEVDELEYIINFCEQNLHVVNDKQLDDEELKEIDRLKQSSEKFIAVQYVAIAHLFKEFKSQLTSLILQFRPELEKDENLKEDFLKFFVDYLNSMQEKFRILSLSMNKKNIKSTYRDVFDFNKWDSKWEKSERIKENVKKDYEKSGPGNAKLEFKNIKDMVDDVYFKNEKAGEKK